MLALKHTYRNIFFLFLLVYTPLYIHSHTVPLSLDILNISNEVIENGQISSNASKENNLVNIPKTKLDNTYSELSYYLYVEDFIKSFIEIPSSNVAVDSSTLTSKYLAGRAPIYNRKNEKVGICSASFLCMQNEDGIYTDISNYLSVNNGLIISWFTPTTLINLELDSIVHSMVTECIVKASTKVGFNPFYGQTFNMIVSSDNQRIYFNLTNYPNLIPDVIFR